GAGGEEFVLWILIEDVVDDLHGINETTAHGAHAVPRLPTIEADADGAEQTLTAQLIEPLVPTIIIHPTVLPDVQLHQIVAVETCVPETLVDFTFDVVGRICVFNRV